jgi:hypothetical protein
MQYYMIYNNSSISLYYYSLRKYFKISLKDCKKHTKIIRITIKHSLQKGYLIKLSTVEISESGIIII